MKELIIKLKERYPEMSNEEIMCKLFVIMNKNTYGEEKQK